MVSAIQQRTFTADDISTLKERLASGKPISQRMQDFAQRCVHWGNRLTTEDPKYPVYVDALRSGFHAILGMTSEWVNYLEHVTPFYPLMSEADRQYFAFVVVESGPGSREDVRVLRQYCSNDDLLGPLLPAFSRLVE
jgi:hypothetical protein